MTTSRSTEELAAYIREQLLSTPPSRVTREVESWATDTGVDATTGDLLDRYREAYEERRASLFAELRRQTGDAARRLALIGLLNRPGVSDVERLFTLDVLDGTITRSDVSPIASAMIKQRSGVARRAAEILAEVPSGETFFALKGSRVFGLIGPLFPLFPINGGFKRGREQVIIGLATPITRRYQLTMPDPSKPLTKTQDDRFIYLIGA